MTEVLSTQTPTFLHLQRLPLSLRGFRRPEPGQYSSGDPRLGGCPN